MRRSQCFLVSMAFVSQSAHAGWQSASWGSTPAQVAKATASVFPAGDPHKANPDNGSTYAIGNYSAGPFDFSAAYKFTESRLSNVQLTLINHGDCSALLSSLRAKYGKPVSETTTVPNVRIWRDVPHDNVVELKIYADTFCTVDYSPLRTSATKGL